MTTNSDKTVAALITKIQSIVAAYAQTNCMIQSDLLAGTIAGSTSPVNFIITFNGINYDTSDSAVLNQFNGLIAGMSPTLFPTSQNIACGLGDLAACQSAGTCTISVTDALTPVVTPPLDCPVTGTDLTSDGTTCMIGLNAAFLFIDLS